jgi:hypothetical protein
MKRFFQPGQETCSRCNGACPNMHVICCALPQGYVFVTIVFARSTNKPLCENAPDLMIVFLRGFLFWGYRGVEYLF